MQLHREKGVPAGTAMLWAGLPLILSTIGRKEFEQTTGYRIQFTEFAAGVVPNGAAIYTAWATGKFKLIDVKPKLTKEQRLKRFVEACTARWHGFGAYRAGVLQKDSPDHVTVLFFPVDPKALHPEARVQRIDESGKSVIPQIATSLDPGPDGVVSFAGASDCALLNDSEVFEKIPSYSRSKMGEARELALAELASSEGKKHFDLVLFLGQTVVRFLAPAFVKVVPQEKWESERNEFANHFPSFSDCKDWHYRVDGFLAKAKPEIAISILKVSQKKKKKKKNEVHYGYIEEDGASAHRSARRTRFRFEEFESNSTGSDPVRTINTRSLTVKRLKSENNKRK
jgi:hypothetical protein